MGTRHSSVGCRDIPVAPFWLTNVCVGSVLIAVVWLRGNRPGIGTIAQPPVSGLTVSGLMPLLHTPQSTAGQLALLLTGVGVLTLGVATYLAADFGAGPIEAAPRTELYY